MKGVLEEEAEVLEDTEKGLVRDAALISACQRLEHYEIAGYGSARDFAQLLGQSEIASSLDETLAEEKNADKSSRALQSKSIRGRNRKPEEGWIALPDEDKRKQAKEGCAPLWLRRSLPRYS